MFTSSLFFLRARKLLASLQSRQSMRALKSGVALSIEHTDALKGKQYRTIIDVGANKGQFALLARSLFHDATILSFEPVEEAATKFRAVFHDDPHVTLFEAAIGPERIRRSMFITSENDSSSFLKPTTLQEDVFGTEVASIRDIEIVRAEDIISAASLKSPVLLKIDVQGFELSVLQGFESLLSSIADVYVECSYQELYAGQGLASDIVCLLQKHGLILAGVFNQASDAGGRALQADFLFSRPPKASR